MVFGRKEKNYLESLESGGIEELIDGFKARSVDQVETMAQRSRNPLDSGSDSDDTNLMGRGIPAVSGPGGVSIHYHAGLVHKQDVFLFKKLLFRASHGKVLCKVCDDRPIEYNLEGMHKKSNSFVFVLVFQDVNVLRQKILRICNVSSNGKTYNLPMDGQGT